MTRIYIDPPSGWRYGFPLSMSEAEYRHVDIREWLEEKGYPHKGIEFAMQHLRVWTSEDDE